MDLHWANEKSKTHIPAATMFLRRRRRPRYIIKDFFVHFRAAKGLIQSLMFVKPICTAWPQTNGDPAFCNVHSQSLFCGFRVLCVSGWSISQRKAGRLSSPIRPRETTWGKCVCCTSSNKPCETTQFLFRSRVCSFFPSDATFRRSAVVNLPEPNHSRIIPLKLVLFCWSATTQTMAPRGTEEPDMLKHPLVFLISVHFWRSRQREVDCDSAQARDWIWRGHLSGLNSISSAKRFESPGEISLEKRVQNRIHEGHCKTNKIKRHKRVMG